MAVAIRLRNLEAIGAVDIAHGGSLVGVAAIESGEGGLGCVLPEVVALLGDFPKLKGASVCMAQQRGLMFQR